MALQIPRIITLILTSIFFVTLCGLFVNTHIVSAQGNEDLNAPGGNTNVGGGNTNTGGGNVNPGVGGSGQLTNPLQSQSIQEFILKVIDVILIFALPIIVLYIMYAGFLFVTAKGDTGQISTAKTALLYSVIGGVIVLGAKVIVTVIEGTIKGF